MAPLKGERRCWAHSPRTARRRGLASSRGGRATRVGKAARPVPVASIPDLQRYVGQAIADVLLRENTERRANSIARLVEVARRLIEHGDLNDRLDLIERRLEAMEGMRR